MLKITIPGMDFYNEKTEEFVKTKARTIHLEHSLVSISKWESKWNKPFLKKELRTEEESLDYIKCMTVTPNIEDEIYLALTNDNVSDIERYISADMTATTIAKQKENGHNKETITSELIYYWMICHNIPFECQKWHLNRLLTLISICNIKNAPPKKRSKRDIMSRNKSLNEQRLKQLNHGG